MIQYIYPKNNYSQDLTCFIDSLFREHPVFSVTGKNIVFFVDPDSKEFEYAKQLPDNTAKILFVYKSPAKCPPDYEIVLSPVWQFVVSFNREIETKNTVYYDIPFINQKTRNFIVSEQKHSKGIFIGNNKKTYNSYYMERNNFLLELKKRGLIDIYGAGWPKAAQAFAIKEDMVETISQYSYNLVIENCKYAGYVSPKLYYSFLSERPSLYFGDKTTARQRFPDTFVPLQNFEISEYTDREKEIAKNYAQLQKAVLETKAKQTEWHHSFFKALSSVFDAF